MMFQVRLRISKILFLSLASAFETDGLYGPDGVPLSRPQWGGQVEQLSEEPPMYILRGFISTRETDSVIADYDVFTPESDRQVNGTLDLTHFHRCSLKFPAKHCASDQASGDKGDFHEDPARFHSATMTVINRRIAAVLGVERDQIEAAWLFHWWQRQTQALHLDNYHHFVYPLRVASVIMRLRDDPVGTAFPLARTRSPHSISDNDRLVSRIANDANKFPFRGSGAGRMYSKGEIYDAFLEVCASSPIKLGQGDALLYYHLDGKGAIDVRALHASCPTSVSPDPKMSLVKFVRATSLAETHGSIRTPPMEQDLFSWINSHGVDGPRASVGVIQQSEHNEELKMIDNSDCRGGASPFWAIRLDVNDVSVMCETPSEDQYAPRESGDRFTVKIAFANTGYDAWPSGIYLAVRGGDPMGMSPAMFPPIEAGEVMSMVLNFHIPEEPGRKLFGVFTLADGDRKPFGPLMWIDAHVQTRKELDLR